MKGIDWNIVLRRKKGGRTYIREYKFQLSEQIEELSLEQERS